MRCPRAAADYNTAEAKAETAAKKDRASTDKPSDSSGRNGPAAVAITPNVVVQTSDPYYKTMLAAYNTYLGQCPSCASVAKGDVAQQEWFWSNACHWVQNQGDCDPHFLAALSSIGPMNPTRSDQAFIISNALPGGYSEGALVNQATCGGMSFSASTNVLLASGKTAPISRLKPGDKVLAVDTRTGKSQPEAVTAVLVHHDTDLYNLKVRDHGDTPVIDTTSNHLFWDPYLHQWVPASHLKTGEHLKTPNGTLATADGGTTPKDHKGWMWDLTVPGNNDHDFYVTAGSVAVLVHNVDGDQCYGPYHRRPGPQTNEEMTAARNGQATELRGGVNRGSSFRSVDAHYGPLPEGKQGYEFYTSVKPSDSGVGSGIVRWVEGTPGVTEISDDLVAIPIDVGSVVLP